MRAFFGFSAVAALMCVPAVGWSQQNSSQSGQAASSSAASSPNKSSSAQSDQAAQAAAPQQTSLADAARKARDEKKVAKPGKVYTNDNIPASGGISPAGATPAAFEAGTSAPASASGKDEKTWRDKFAQLRQKLDRDKENLDVMQRELATLNLQYYPDPTKAMQQQLSREDINKKNADIENKKKDIAADEQAINDAEEALRKVGGDPGWAR